MNIVVGYIPTPEGLAAVDYASDAAERESAHLVVVNTGHRGVDADPSFAGAADLDALDAKLAERGISHEVRQPVQSRSAAEEIVRVARETEAGLVVIGLRRRSPVGKVLMGSTAQEVLLDAECPVVAVKRTASATARS